MLRMLILDKWENQFNLNNQLQYVVQTTPRN